MSFDPGVFDPQLFGAGLMSDSCLFDGAIFDSAVFDVCEDVAPEVVAESPSPAVRSRRYRIIEDPDRIEEEIRAEEKKVEKDKKRLVILLQRASAPNVEGVLYQQIQYKVEKLEAKIDGRMERIAMLIASLDMDDEEEEEMWLLQ